MRFSVPRSFEREFPAVKKLSRREKWLALRAYLWFEHLGDNYETAIEKAIVVAKRL